MRLKKVLGVFIFLILTLGILVSADIFSINSGGSTGIVITPSPELEGFFFKFNVGPFNPVPLLTSLNGRNESNTNLNCSFDVVDQDSPTLNVSVKWYKNESYQFLVNHSSISNNTHVNSLLLNGNLTLGDVWKCSVSVSDPYNSTQFINSNDLTIIDITNPNVTIISPNSSINYPTLDVDFNVSVSENENISACLYSLDFDSNVTMNRLNDSYFWDSPNLGPGPHDLTYYCNDTSNNWGTNSTNFTILNSAAISILLSDNLTSEIRWNVLYLPVNDLDAVGNNLNSSTWYMINISATNTLVDLYVKADGDLYTESLDVLGLGNETYTFNSTDPTVSGSNKTTMTINYSLIGDALGDNSVIYMKFYLDAPSTQSAGIYSNALQFRAVRNGETP
ncbi:hypothetical protein COT60_02340 [Candidatus Pacearchaeota archaeon CG09_land_8_20_14_0_10_30_9]|nr:hypothetical protein [Candidatus Pacearchaeota archaeon]OIO40932.1 MAG: hypothetical protein AUJ61_00535 [Candidatus Pacearchaeota archaeon CG1_02_30_18]PIN71701.1 MAG: hypothetical protein COV77_00335 [Candidatus Pacearchaeota archaeon CG11_big_fil_rev_8_21_14_0_20_30_13]PIO01078.1 MAG: hypothetical protein COT60_02340 [Candidatus Pacearchaeota archaeon CG09_land_8_20_14_0_10_30_9]